MCESGIDNDTKIVSRTELAFYSKTNNAPIALLVSLVEVGPTNDALCKAKPTDATRSGSVRT